MVIAYVDTSAALKLLVDEPDSAALAAYLQADDEAILVACWLLHTELHCAADRHPNEIEAASVDVVLDTVDLVDLTRGDLLTAAALPGRLRSHDAIHLTVALRAGIDEMITYDQELADAASAAGLKVTKPS